MGFAAVAGELLPEITAGRPPLGVVIGSALSGGVMLAVRAAVGIGSLTDGLLISVGFAAGERVGTLLVVALTPGRAERPGAAAS